MALRDSDVGKQLLDLVLMVTYLPIILLMDCSEDIKSQKVYGWIYAAHNSSACMALRGEPDAV